STRAQPPQDFVARHLRKLTPLPLLVRQERTRQERQQPPHEWRLPRQGSGGEPAPDRGIAPGNEFCPPNLFNCFGRLSKVKSTNARVGAKCDYRKSCCSTQRGFCYTTGNRRLHQEPRGRSAQSVRPHLEGPSVSTIKSLRDTLARLGNVPSVE